ncbi:MAG: trigger factor [Wujia sp.]
MNKNMRKLGCALAMAASLTMLGGCGKTKPEDIIDKYGAMCELGDYKGVEYVETRTEITDAMVDSEVNDFLSQYAVSQEVTEGTAALGDQVNIDFVGYVDGVAFDGGSSNGAGYTLELGSGTMIDGFEEQIVGHDVGETFDIDVTFPDEYPSNPDLAGQPAVFEITLNSITQTILPDYTDEFVASNTDASNIEEYEQSVRDSLASDYTESDANYNKSAIMQVILENATIKEYPEKEMQDLIDSTMNNVQSEADQYGYDLATYIAARYGISSEDSFRDYISGMVEDFMQEKIVICAIAKAENITVSNKEIDAYKKEMMDSTGVSDEDEFGKYYTDEDVMYYTIADKVMDFLLENGTPTTATETDAASGTDAE